MDSFVLPFCMLGLVISAKTLFKLVRWVWCMFLRQPKKLTNYGSWALITGCTDGIGKSLSFDLASKGLNLILVGRNLKKLEAISNDILHMHGEKVKVKVVDFDFARVSGEQVEEKIKESVEDLDVGVLVNNVGMSFDGPKYFHEIGSDGFVDLVNVNVGGSTWVTKAVLPGMLKRNKGAILNIGSGSMCAVPSYPLFAIYAATKGYIAMFSKSLHVEYKKHGIDIQCQIPLLVATKMAGIKRSSFFVPSPEEYSKASIRWIGYEFQCVPYWTHSLQCFLMSLVPDSLLDWLLFRYFLDLRKRILQKETLKHKN